MFLSTVQTIVHDENGSQAYFFQSLYVPTLKAQVSSNTIRISESGLVLIK